MNKKTTIEISKVFLDLKNPRFPEGKVKNESEAISLLCKDEYILNLARDIVKIKSINPLELIGFLEEKTSPNKFIYTVLEGNRRICALKLIVDPEKAPLEQKKYFKKLSEEWKPDSFVSGVVFETRESAKIWLERLHGDFNNGIARKKWSADEKSRFSGDSKNALAQEILDYAEKNGFISETNRKNRLTTASRFLGNPVFRAAIGIEKSNDSTMITFQREDFHKRLKCFITDLIINNKVSSRANAEKIKKYAQYISQSIPIENLPEIPESLTSDYNHNKNKSVGVSKSVSEDKQVHLKNQLEKNKPQTPPQNQHIQHNEEINRLLKIIKNSKLENLYFGISKLPLKTYFIPILTISCWSFIESLSAANGRNNTSFHSFYSKEKLKKLGLDKSKGDSSAIREALKRLEDNGNTSKHHFVSANFNGPQLANDMECLTPLIIATLNEIISKKNIQDE